MQMIGLISTLKKMVKAFHTKQNIGGIYGNYYYTNHSENNRVEKNLILLKNISHLMVHVQCIR